MSFYIVIHELFICFLTQLKFSLILSTTSLRNASRVKLLRYDIVIKDQSLNGKSNVKSLR